MLPEIGDQKYCCRSAAKYWDVEGMHVSGVWAHVRAGEHAAEGSGEDSSERGHPHAGGG